MTEQVSAVQVSTFQKMQQERQQRVYDEGLNPLHRKSYLGSSDIPSIHRPYYILDAFGLAEHWEELVKFDINYAVLKSLNFMTCLSDEETDKVTMEDVKWVSSMVDNHGYYCPVVAHIIPNKLKHIDVKTNEIAKYLQSLVDSYYEMQEVYGDLENWVSESTKRLEKLLNLSDDLSRMEV